MHKKRLVILAVILLLCLLAVVGYDMLRDREASPAQNALETDSQVVEKNYLLSDYPSDVVPLFQMKVVSSSKFFVNADPANFPIHQGEPVNYFNVVFETQALPQEYLAYYRSLMSEVDEEDSSQESIEGRIGKYWVVASHFGDNPENYGYLQVYLPSAEYQSVNRYYQEYPGLVELDPAWKEYESSYGLLNQKGGEVEYTQYFPVDTDPDGLINLTTSYKDKYSSKDGYSFDAESGLMTWKDGDYSVWLTFSQDHSRVYLMMRRPML